MNQEVEKAAEIIGKGGIILYPTETVWGLGCDPSNEEAVQRIVELKGKVSNKGLIVIVPDERLLKRYVKEIPDVCYDLIDYADRPITIIYPRGQYVAQNVLGPESSIAVRITDNDFCCELMKRTKTGLVSTSANVHGEPTAKKLQDISEVIRQGVDYIVDVPKYEGGDKASQIIRIGMNNEVEIIRK